MVAGRLLSGCEGPDAAVARACPEGSRQSLSAVRCGRSFQVVRRYGFGRDRIGSRRVQRSTDRSFTASAATTRTARKTTTVAGGRASTSTGIAAGRSNGKPKKRLGPGKPERRPNPANHRRQAFALLRPHLGHMDRARKHPVQDQEYQRSNKLQNTVRDKKRNYSNRIRMRRSEQPKSVPARQPILRLRNWSLRPVTC